MCGPRLVKQDQLSSATVAHLGWTNKQSVWEHLDKSIESGSWLLEVWAWNLRKILLRHDSGGHLTHWGSKPKCWGETSTKMGEKCEVAGRVGLRLAREACRRFRLVYIVIKAKYHSLTTHEIPGTTKRFALKIGTQFLLSSSSLSKKRFRKCSRVRDPAA